MRTAYIVVAVLILIALGCLVVAAVQYWQGRRSGSTPSSALADTPMPILVGLLVVMILLVVIALIW